MTQKKYSFKAVGETPGDLAQRTRQAISSPPIGIMTPMALGEGGDGIFKMHHDLGNTVGDNLRNLIQTNWGERLMDYNFGANLKELTFELGNEDIDAVAITRIKAATDKYLPYISLDTFEPFNALSDESGVARIGVRITYTVPLIDTKTRSLEVTLHTAG